MDATEIIRAALAKSSQTAEQKQANAEATASFAEMNAVPMSSNTRRRPGANMTGYLTMAKTMKSGR
ncbi:MAG: hypothetical protein HC805_05105 [Alkalinema sp. RL_2_19]|nr:hypothetical protein [Alkalinema sp. RL_2_19]